MKRSNFGCVKVCCGIEGCILAVIISCKLDHVQSVLFESFHGVQLLVQIDSLQSFQARVILLNRKGLVQLAQYSIHGCQHDGSGEVGPDVFPGGCDGFLDIAGRAILFHPFLEVVLHAGAAETVGAAQVDRVVEYVVAKRTGEQCRYFFDQDLIQLLGGGFSDSADGEKVCLLCGDVIVDELFDVGLRLAGLHLKY